MKAITAAVLALCCWPLAGTSANLDLDADKKADLWWFNSTSGEHWAYQMDGLRLKASAPIALIPTAWTLIGRGDFDADGKADALWRHTNGELWLYLMDGTKVRQELPLMNISLDWRLEAVADWNGDGSDDLLWFHPASGELWLLGLKAGKVVDSRSLFVAPKPWTLLAAVDVDGDHKKDLLWREPTTGEVWLTRQDGRTIVKDGHWASIDLAWQLAAVGDFDGNGTDDLWWRHKTTGDNVLLLTQGDGFREWNSATIADLNWQPAATGDFNADGTDDILWRNQNTGENWLYLLKNAQIASQGPINSAPSQWQVMQNPPLSLKTNSSSSAVVSYDFSAGDNLAPKNGWSFESLTWPISNIAATSTKALDFKYLATVPGELPASPELQFKMPAADEFWLKLRLHIPANYQRRSDTHIKVGDAKAAGWQLNDQLVGADGSSTGSISGFNSEGVFVRYAQKGAYNEVWGSADAPKAIKNLTRNKSLTSNGRSVWGSGQRLLSLWNDAYSLAGTGSSLNFSLVSEFQFSGLKDSILTAGYRVAGNVGDGNRGSFAGLIGDASLVTDANKGTYLDWIVHAKFASQAHAKDGQIHTWVRYQGETSYKALHKILDADLDKGVSNKGWQAGALMGESNGGYDQDTSLYVSKLDYFKQAPAELGLAPVVLVAPSQLQADLTGSAAKLSWQAVSGASGYRVYYSTDPAFTRANASKLDTTGTSLSLPNLLASTTYYALITAINSDGESVESSKLQFKTPVANTNAQSVSYDFGAGDTLAAKGGWAFESSTWPINPVPGTNVKGLPFTYLATVPGEYPPNAEMRFTMPPADEFWLKLRLHIPSNYQLRSDTLIKVANAKAAGWQLNDQLRGADGLSTGTISGFSTDGVFVRYAQKGSYNEVWGSEAQPKTVTNLTRNSSLTSSGRMVWDTGNKLLAIWNEGYSVSGTGSTIILGMISDYTFSGAKDAIFTASYRIAGAVNDGSRTTDSLSSGTLMGEALRGKYLDLVLRAKFSSREGAKDGVLQTWVRYEGETNYSLRHNVTDANMDKGVSQKSWQAGYLMGWSNVGYDQDTSFYISKLDYLTQAPAELTANTALAAPAQLQVDLTGANAKLSWQAVTGATGYRVYYSTDAAFTRATATKLELSGNSTSLSGLAAATTYYALVTAIKGSDEGAESSKLAFKTPAAVVVPVTAAGLLWPNGIEPGDPKVCEAPASRRCWWVDAAAVTNGDGSYAKPFNHFGLLEPAINGGDVIYLRGTFDMASHSASRQMSLNLHTAAASGSASEPTTIKSWRGSPRAVFASNRTDAQLRMSNNAGIRLQNLEISGFADQGITVDDAVVYAEFINIVAHDGQVTGTSGVGGGLVIHAQDSLHNFTVRNSLFYDTAGAEPRSVNTGALSIISEPTALAGSVIHVYNNVFRDNHVALRQKHAGRVHMNAYGNLLQNNQIGFYLRAWSADIHHNILSKNQFGVYLDSDNMNANHDYRIYHNSFYDNAWLLLTTPDQGGFVANVHLDDNLVVDPSGGKGLIHVGSLDWNWGTNNLSGWSMKNNVFFYSPTTRPFLYSAAPTAANNRDLTAGLSQLGDSNSIFADPLFSNPEAGDFSLKTGSPALGKGSNGSTPGAL